ncbi:hypothetical protein [Alkanindiges hydrocarboniclasticus]|nr:hypothetical protein [Alkanindiges hydrocarboniclasticus]
MKLNQTLALTSLVLTSWTHAGLNIYASKGLFGVDGDCPAAASPAKAVDCGFIEAIDAPSFRHQLNQLFSQQLQQDFPQQVVSQIDSSNKQRTFVASLEVLRAKRYEVQKQSTTEIFLPVTLNLKLTNILTGEVLYSTSSTLNQPLQVLTTELDSPAVNTRLQTQYQRSLLSLAQQVTGKLKQELQLSEIQTEVIDQWKNYLILNKGYVQGIGRDDELSAPDGGLIRVVQADSNYSVAIPVLLGGKAKQFSKLSSSAAGALNKPKVLVADVLTYQDESRELVEQIFAGAVGDQAAFSLTPVNRQYALLAQNIGEQTKLAQAEDINRRALPEFFIRLAVLPTLSVEQPTGSMTTQRITHAQVMGELVDASGQVIFAAWAEDHIEDVISEGMSFSADARREIAVKNALLKLADQFKREVKFTKADLKVAAVNGQQLIIDDPAQRLTEGLSLKIYRAQTIQGKSIMVPIWDARVDARQGPQVSASLILPVSGDGQQAVGVNKGDSIFLDTSSNVANLAQAHMFCPNLATEQLGNIRFDAYTPLSYVAFARYSKFPFYATGAGLSQQQPLAQSVLGLTKGAGFRTDIKPHFVVPTQHCLQPVYRINPSSTSACTRVDTRCEETLVMAAGIRTFNAQGTKTGAAGLEQEIKIKGINPQYRDAQYQLELLKFTPELLKKIVEKTDSPTTK